jgi:hypothetical protein
MSIGISRSEWLLRENRAEGKLRHNFFTDFFFFSRDSIYEKIRKEPEATTALALGSLHGGHLDGPHPQICIYSPEKICLVLFSKREKFSAGRLE